LVGNLVTNAINHGALDEPVRVALLGVKDEVRLTVTNIGHMDQATVAQMFEPLKGGTGRENDSGLGLGLYIASEIAKAHGGKY
jgi:signal transduction histidine kinase